MNSLLRELGTGWEGMHSPEPWEEWEDDGGVCILAAPGSLPSPRRADKPSDALIVCEIAHPEGEGPATDLMRANAARIAACVNFCRGFSGGALSETTLRELLAQKSNTAEGGGG